MNLPDLTALPVHRRLENGDEVFTLTFTLTAEDRHKITAFDVAEKVAAEAEERVRCQLLATLIDIVSREIDRLVAMTTDRQNPKQG